MATRQALTNSDASRRPAQAAVPRSLPTHPIHIHSPREDTALRTVPAGPQRLHLRAFPPAQARLAPAALPTSAAAQHSPVRSPEPRRSVPGNGHETARGEEAAGQAPHVLLVPQQGAAQPVRTAVARHGGRPPSRPDTATLPAPRPPPPETAQSRAGTGVTARAGVRR